MKSLPLRVTWLGIAVLAAVGLLIWAGDISSREFQQLDSHFGTTQVESFQIADQLQRNLLENNNLLLRAALRDRKEDWQRFSQSSESFNFWIARQYFRLSTDAERDILRRIDTSYTSYLTVARSIYTQSEKPAHHIPLESLGQIDRLTGELLEDGYELATAHQAAFRSLLDNARTSTRLLQRIVYGCLGLSVLCGISVAVLAYRETIAPLRLRLVESQALLERQEKLASLGVMAAGIAHEIRNPLTAVKARIYSLNKEISDNPRALEKTEIISRETLRLEKIVNQFLQFARPADPAWEPLEAGALLAEIQQFLSPEAEQKGIAIHIQPGPRLSFQGDHDQLKQVLLNLIRNAMEAVPATGGSVTLRHRQELRRLRGQTIPAVILQVEDNGPGIPADVHKRLFDPFFTTKEAGTGLGLSIASRIMEKHGGALEFQTRPHTGTLFGMVIPFIPLRPHENKT